MNQRGYTRFFSSMTYLSDFLDYDRLGQHQIDEEGGVFGAQGYIAYRGDQPGIKEILARHVPSVQDPQMGGLS